MKFTKDYTAGRIQHDDTFPFSKKYYYKSDHGNSKNTSTLSLKAGKNSLVASAQRLDTGECF